MSHMTTLSTVLCLKISLAVDPSPPPIIKILSGLQNIHLRSLQINQSNYSQQQQEKKNHTLGGGEEQGEQEIHGK